VSKHSEEEENSSVQACYQQRYCAVPPRTDLGFTDKQ